MACQGCSGNNGNPPFFSYPLGQNNPCAECGNSVDSLCVTYTGPELQCFTTGSNLTLQDMIQELDQYICNLTTGSGYDPSWNTSCLLSLSSTPITTMQEFVESISAYVCEANETFENFRSTTYAADVISLFDTISLLTNPTDLTACDYTGITVVDPIDVAVAKLSAAVCSIASELALPAVNWEQCFIVVPPPSNINDGFNTLIDMICQVHGSIPPTIVLPTFDNTGSCLPAPTTTDSLVKTINDIKGVLCIKPDFSPASVTPTCMGLDSTSLQTVVQSIVDQVELASGAIMTADPLFFTETLINPLNPCEGKHLTFTGSLVSEDRFVALNAGDLTPGTLVQKITNGPNVSLDFGVANPGQLTISSTDEFVRVTPGDTTPGHLLNKLDVLNDSTNSLSFSEVFNAGTGKMEITPLFNFSALASEVLNAIVGDPGMQSILCATVCNQCLPCATSTPASFVSMQVTNLGVAVDVGFGLRQVSPAVIFVSVPALALAATTTAGDTYNSALFQITDPAAPPATMLLDLSNLETPGNQFEYSIIVEDGTGTEVPGATKVPPSGALPTLNGGASYSNIAFSLGTSPTNNYVVKVTVRIVT